MADIVFDDDLVRKAGCFYCFDAFKDIDNTELVGKYTFKTNREAFDFAVNALKGLLTKQGYKEVDGVWKK